MMMRFVVLRFLAGGVAAALLAAPTAARAEFIVKQTNLVSNVPGLAANTDPNLRNPWGISFAPTGPFWVSNQVTGNTTLYNGSGTPQSLVVAIPGGNPTGQVFNPFAGNFVLPVGGRALFLFATLNGTITGWNGPSGTMAQIAASQAGSVYTGLAIGSVGPNNFLYAADVLNGQIDVFNSTFQPANLTGSFTDPSLPAGFTPFNVQNLGGTLYVTYENLASGGGVVNAFDTDGNFLRRVSANGAGGPLDNPWGLALAPAGFGNLGGRLLVGNEGDGHISVFDPLSGVFLGQLVDQSLNPIANTGLWGLRFGNGGNGGNPNVLYFTAGINGEVDGLFGSLVAVPEPASWLLLGLGAVGLAARGRWRGKR
jgi:uncharacterized protein (TIGR03118 family)